MKKILFAVCIMLASSTFTVPAHAGGNSAKDVTTVPSTQVPQRILMQFHSMYPGATNVQWELLPPAYYGSTQYRASFKLNGFKMKVYLS